MKAILVPTESHDAMRPALATALLLARRFDSYIEGFALRFRVNEFVAVDMAGFDYAAVLDAAETLMRCGDVLVQRGTNHAWSNRSTKPCLVGFVLLDAEPRHA